MNTISSKLVESNLNSIQQSDTNINFIQKHKFITNDEESNIEGAQTAMMTNKPSTIPINDRYNRQRRK